MQTSKGCAYLMDMGTGKTITTIALAGAMYGQGNIGKLLVVAPKSIVDVWQQEFEKFASFPYSLAVLDGTGTKKADTIRNMVGTGLQVIVVNYESCWRLESEITKWRPDMIPEFIDEIRTVRLEPKAQKIYDGISKDSYAELSKGEVTTRNVLTQLLRLSQCTGGFIRNDDGDDAQQVSTAKLEALEDIIDDCVDAGKKVVVFARFVPEINAISRMLMKKGIDHSVIKGDVTDRAVQVATFQNDPDCKVFIGQLATTGMGLTLTAGTVAVYYSLDFSFANYEQSRARIRRIGQTKRGVYIHLVAKDTIDEHVMSALQHKGDIAKLVVDNYQSILGGKAL